MRINQYDEAWVTWWDGESCTRRGGGRGRLRAEPKADDPADNPRWESRRARVQKDMTPLAAEDRGSIPCTAVSPGAGCCRELGEGKKSMCPGLWSGI